MANMKMPNGNVVKEEWEEIYSNTTSPFSSAYFTLNEDMTNYRFLKIVCYWVTGTGTAIKHYPEFIVDVEYFKTYARYGTNTTRIAVAGNGGGGDLYYRQFWWYSDTQIGTTSTSNAIIPYKVYGTK